MTIKFQIKGWIPYFKKTESIKPCKIANVKKLVWNHQSSPLLTRARVVDGIWPNWIKIRKATRKTVHCSVNLMFSLYSHLLSIFAMLDTLFIDVTRSLKWVCPPSHKLLLWHFFFRKQKNVAYSNRKHIKKKLTSITILSRPILVFCTRVKFWWLVAVLKYTVVKIDADFLPS